MVWTPAAHEGCHPFDPASRNAALLAAPFDATRVVVIGAAVPAARLSPKVRRASSALIRFCSTRLVDLARRILPVNIANAL